jgi:hypothetical protein
VGTHPFTAQVMKKSVTIAEAEADPYGRNCPNDLAFPCTSTGPHTEWTTPSGKVYTICSKCKKAFIISQPQS